jgi:hypothetical protein
VNPVDAKKLIERIDLWLAALAPTPNDKLELVVRFQGMKYQDVDLNRHLVK